MSKGLVTWIRPSGSKIEINNDPANIKAAVELGWKPKTVVDDEKKGAKAKKGTKK